MADDLIASNQRDTNGAASEQASNRRAEEQEQEEEGVKKEEEEEEEEVTNQHKLAIINHHRNFHNETLNEQVANWNRSISRAKRESERKPELTWPTVREEPQCEQATLIKRGRHEDEARRAA